MLLSVKADGLAAVSGNAEFGNPSAVDQPFGPYFGVDGLDKRQVESEPVGTPLGAPWLSPNETSIPAPGGPLIGVPIDFPGSAPIESPIPELVDPLFNVPIATPTPGPIEPLIDPTVYFPDWVPIDPPTPALSDPVLELPAPTEPFVIDSTIDSAEPPIFTPLETPNSEPIISTDAPIEEPPLSPFPILNLTVPLGPGPVMLNGTVPPPLTTDSPIIVVEPNPIDLNYTTPPSPIFTNEPLPFPDSNPTVPIPSFPNLFSTTRPPSALALTLFSLFGEGHTERADLRPLGPDTPSSSSPAPLNGTDWVNPLLASLPRPLGEEVVVDGFDVQVPAEWRGSYQDTQFHTFVDRLRELTRQAWRESGGVEGGPGDLGADGRGVVYFGWIGGALRTRTAGLEVRAEVKREGWREWNGEA